MADAYSCPFSCGTRHSVVGRGRHQIFSMGWFLGARMGSRQKQPKSAARRLLCAGISAISSPSRH